MNAHTSRISMWAALSLSVSLLFVILLGVGAPRSASSQQGPALSLKPSSGPAGTTVQVRGEGFGSHCGVNLFLDSTKSAALGFAKVGSPGSFSAQVTIPSETTLGEHTIIAQGLVFAGEFSSCNNPTGTEVPASFTVIEDEFRILFKKRAFTPDPGLNIGEIRQHRNGQPSDRVHFLLQFETIPNADAKTKLAAQGLDLGPFVTGNAYIASMLFGNLEKLLEIPGLRWAGPLEVTDKISPELSAGKIGQWARTKGGRVVLTIQAHRDVSLQEVEELIKGLGGERTASVSTIPSVTAKFPFSPELVNQLAKNDNVQFVDVAPPQLEEQNDGARAAANVDPLAMVPFNLNGTGTTVLVYDSGVVDSSHPDFGTRVIETDGDVTETTRDHSTHVAGTVAGSGANSNGNDSAGNPNGGTPNQWAGMAPQANIRSFGLAGSSDALYDDAGDLNGDFITAINNGIDLATMSLGNNVVPNGFPCGQLGDYTNTAILIDNIVTGSIAGQQLIYFESAGNERVLGAPCGQFSTISSPATSKNSIVVGAINSNDNSITGFTSFGPTDDGRLKPDITAPGGQTGGDNGITSPSFDDAPPGPLTGNGNLDAGETQNTYIVKSGTSMATPVAAGATALLIEQWQSTRGAGTRPLPHTVKAILTHTANDLGNAGPDYQFGWGALDARGAVELVIADDSAALIHVEQVDHGDTDSFIFNSDGSSDMRVTLVWDDPAATRLAAVTQINDLDLRLMDPDGIVFMPFVLNSAIPGNAATPGNDTLNNVEMVIGTAKAGLWTVTVTGTDATEGPQQYTLITPENAVMPADLTIAKKDAPDPVPAGGTLVYTLEVTNDGPGLANDIEVKDILPPGVTYMNDDCNGTVALPTVTCALFDLAPTDNKIIAIEVQVDADLVDATGSASLSNNAEVTSLTTPDPDTNNNTTTEDTEVLPGCAGEFATITGTPGTDSILGTTGHDVIATLAGIDTITGRDGDDKICGGSGHDNIVGGSGNDVIEGGSGNDNLVGGSGFDTIDGGPGDDQCLGENVTNCNP